MAYIGKIPAAAALTADDITDGIITNAKLAQDIISAETALTDAPADTDEFLVSDAGTLKRIDASLIGGGALVHLQTQTAGSDVANITFSSTYLTSTYTTYFFTGFVFITTGDQTNLQMHPSIDNGSNYNLDCAGNGEGRFGNTAGDNAGEHSGSQPDTTFWDVATDCDSGSGSDQAGSNQFSGYLWNSPDLTRADHNLYTGHSNRMYASGGTNFHCMPGYFGGGHFDAGANTNNVKFQWATGNIKQGSKISLFGVKQS